MNCPGDLLKMRWLGFIVFVSMSALITYSAIPEDIPPYILKSQDQFDVTYYQLNLSISPAEEIIFGSVIMRAKSTIDGLKKIVLDLYNNMTIANITGNLQKFSHENDLINLTLDRSYGIEDAFEIEIFYSGKPAALNLDSLIEFTPFRFERDREIVMISSESCPYYARAWWPCKDTPSDKADSVHLFITVPENLVVAANGEFKGTIENDHRSRTHHWHIKNPIATYLIAVQISHYRKLTEYYVNSPGDSMEILCYVLPEDCTKVLTNFQRTQEMINILSKYYGDYPYLNEKYAMVETLSKWSAVEYQTLSCFNRDFIANERIALHELSHQWFGNCVTPKDFRHVWISEGFATFSEALYVEHKLGCEKYHEYMNDQNNALAYEGRIFRDEISTPFSIYHPIVYKKGAWVLHMLRHILGDSTFFKALREYRYRFEYSSATTEDFQAVCEELSGSDLDYFFKEWIYDYWHPEYLIRWQSHKLGNDFFRVTGMINQKQKVGPIFKMAIDITIETIAGDTSFVQFVDEKREKFDFIVKNEPYEVIIDKDGWILKEVCQEN